MTYRFFEYQIPFVHPIRIGSQLQSVRKGILIQAKTPKGRVGWGEAAPLDGYGPDTYADVLASIRLFAHAQKAGAQDKEGSFSKTTEFLTFPPSLRFGWACADRAAGGGAHLIHWFGKHDKGSVESAALISKDASASAQEAVSSQEGDSAHEAEASQEADSSRAGDSSREGTSSRALSKTVKTKVGGAPVGEDVARVRNLLDRLPEGGLLRLDANGIWSFEQAIQFAEVIGTHSKAHQIECIEEPWTHCFEDDRLAAFPLKVAMDESFLSLDSPWEKAAIVMIKPSLFGTPEDVLAAARTIQQSGRGVVLSSAFESATGMSVLVSMSAHIGTAAPGFGTYRYLTGDIGPYQDWLCQPAIMYSKLPTEPGSHLDISRMNELIV